MPPWPELGGAGPPKECTSNTSPRSQPCPPVIAAPAELQVTNPLAQGRGRTALPRVSALCPAVIRQTVPSLQGAQVMGKSKEWGSHRGRGGSGLCGGSWGLPAAPSSWHQLCSARSPMAEPSAQT